MAITHPRRDPLSAPSVAAAGIMVIDAASAPPVPDGAAAANSQGAVGAGRGRVNLLRGMGGMGLLMLLCLCTPGDACRSTAALSRHETWSNSPMNWDMLAPPYAATKAVPRLISKGSSSVLASPRVDVGALNHGDFVFGQ
jgi:hypothetical protein